MAWNRPNKETDKQPPWKRKRFHFPIRGVIAGAIVVIGAAIGAWLVLSSSEEMGQDTAQTKTAQIKEVKPSQTLKQVVKVEVSEEGKEPPKPYEDEHGNLWIAPHRPYCPPNTLTITYPDRDEPLERIFNRTCDIRIGQLLSVVPGDEIEMQVFGKRFRDEFIASVADKIEILPDDDDYAKEIKRSVTEVRNEIIERAKAGEDPAKIMTEAWDELYRLGRFKSELRQQILDMSQKGECNPNDVATLVDATDQMLANKGLPPFKNKKFLVRMMRVRAAKAGTDQKNKE